MQSEVNKEVLQVSEPKKMKPVPNSRRKVSSQLEGKKIVKSSLPGKIKSLEQLQESVKIKKKVEGEENIKKHK